MLQLLAQAAPPPTIISGESAITWTVLVVLLALAAAWGAAMVRLSRVEKDLQDTNRRQEVHGALINSADKDVAVIKSSLTRIEAGIVALETHLKAQDRQNVRPA